MVSIGRRSTTQIYILPNSTLSRSGFRVSTSAARGRARTSTVPSGGRSSIASPDARPHVQDGDIARYRADGNIDLLGRVDHKSRSAASGLVGELSVPLQHADVSRPSSWRKIRPGWSPTSLPVPRGPSTRELRDFLHHRLPATVPARVPRRTVPRPTAGEPCLLPIL